MSLSPAQRRDLKARAHHLKPVVQTGARGVTAAVLAEIDLALASHELIKLKLAGSEREQRRPAAQEIASQTGSELVDIIGATAILYREKPRETPAGRS